MRVGLNATVFNDRPSGARQRFLGIYGALIRLRPDWTFVVYEPTDCPVADWFEGAPNVVARRTPLASAGRMQRVLKGATFWRSAFAADRLDLFEDFVLPMVRHPSAPSVLTIHDVRSLHENAGAVRSALRRQVFRRAFAQADCIIAVSGTVRDEILAFHPSARVSVVYNGIDPAEFASLSAVERQAVRCRFGLPDRYMLAIGHLEARKNLRLLIDAVAKLRDRGLERPLVLVGNDGGDRARILTRIAEHRLEALVTPVEGADDAAVRAIYADCAMLAFPSRYEGFGIPILEAMAAGKPMALADTAVFRELTAGRSAYFPVNDAEAAANVIETVWSDATERERQGALGEERVGDFAFPRLAAQVAAIYEELA